MLFKMRKSTIVIALLLLFSIAVTAVAETRSKWAHAYWHGNREEPRIAITIDDWIHPELFLSEFLKVAEEYNVKLTNEIPNRCTIAAYR